MIEKITKINNPLTIIAIFAGLAEVAGTVALGFLAAEAQAVFIWFVMLFPAALVLLFFLTLNFNAKVLYAPSDFKDESNFLDTLGVSRDLEKIQKELNKAEKEIAERISEIKSENEKAKLSAVVRRELGAVSENIEAARFSVSNFAFENQTPEVFTEGKLLQFELLKNDVLSALKTAPENGLEFQELYKSLKAKRNISPAVLKSVLEKLVTKKVIQTVPQTERRHPAGMNAGAFKIVE
jgi:hypothetical protein